MSHWLGDVYIRIWDISVFTFIFVSFGESCLLVSWCVGDRCGMMSSDEDRDRNRRPGAEDWGWSHRLGTRWPDDWEIGWYYVRSTPCTWRRGAWVSCLSLKTKVNGLSVVWTQNHWDGFVRFHLKIGGDGFSLFGLKTIGRFFGWASKLRWWRVFRFGPQNWQIQFVDFALKITATVSWFEPQNQASDDLSVVPQNRRKDETAWGTG
jgi:hypothetical protein